jgi:hypothetical protein
MVIGDVVGHDMAAAARMGQLRSMLRAYIVDRHEPCTVRKPGRMVSRAIVSGALAAVVVMLTR